MSAGRGIITGVNTTLVFAHRYPGKYAFNVLAGALEGRGSDPGLTLVFARERDEMQRALSEAIERGDAVAGLWSFYSPGLPDAAEELREIRKVLGNERFVSIAGGVHATAEPRETLEAGFDFVATGEGEHTILGLVERLRSGNSLEGLKGLSRLVDGHVVGTKGESVTSLDQFAPFAAARGMFGAIELTRGCIYACSFCQTPFLNKARFRHRSPENVARHARALREAGHRDLRFISPTSLSYGSSGEEVNLAAVDELLGRVREAMGADGRIFFGSFPSEVRPEHVTPEALKVLKKWVDNDNLIIGGQSGSERILQKSHRGHDVASIERAVQVAVENGFLPNVDFILGLPGETPDDAAQSLALMERLTAAGAKVHTHTFMPLPGTPFRDAPAGTVDEASRRRLEVLSSSGRAYGQWKKQAEVGQALADRRDRARGRS